MVVHFFQQTIAVINTLIKLNKMEVLNDVYSSSILLLQTVRIFLFLLPFFICR